MSGRDDENKAYRGRTEGGYLPLHPQGLLLLELFKIAFRRRLMFGLGNCYYSVILSCVNT